MVAGSVAIACTDTATTLAGGYQHERSDWYEFDAAGHQMVHESGTLTGPALAVGYRCAHWQLAALMAESDGDRLYDGQTSIGVPVLSHAAIQQHHGQVQASFALSSHWQIGGRWTYQSMARDIASAGGASGYLEQFDWSLLSVGTQWHAEVGPGQLSLAAWWGQQVHSSMRFTLPGRDSTELSLGPIQQMDWTAGWRMPLSTAWYVQANMAYRRTEIGEGAASVITRNGVPVGVAHQPRSVMVSRPVLIQLGYVF